MLGAEVSEATGELIAAMQDAGFSEQQARRADVWTLRNGIYRAKPGGVGEPQAAARPAAARSAALEDAKKIVTSRTEIEETGSTPTP